MANVRKLIGMADAFAARSGPDLRAFADHAAAELDAGAPTPDAPLEVGADEAVRLMTIHGAKGLEFPVVIVADLGRDGGGGTPPVIVRDGRVGLRLPRVDDGEPRDIAFDYAELDLERTEAEAREERRIMHVAVTRAERLLILSGTFRASKGWGDAGLPAPGARVDGPRAVRRGRRRSRRAPAACAAGTAEARVVAQRARRRPRAPEPPAGRGTAAAAPRRRRRAGAALALPAPAGPPPPATLSYSSLTDLRPLRLLAGTCAASCGCPSRPAGELAHVRRVQRRGAPARLDRARRARARGPRERRRRPRTPTRCAPRRPRSASRSTTPRSPISCSSPPRSSTGRGATGRPRRGRSGARSGSRSPLDPDAHDAPLLNGVIDLLAEEDDGGVLVVDHKTDRIAPDTDLEALVARDYAIQRAVYALAALRAGAARVEVAHVYLADRRARRARVYAPADAPGARGARARGVRARCWPASIPVAAEPHAGICATCPGPRRAVLRARRAHGSPAARDA